MRDDPNEVVARGLKDAREKWMAEDPEHHGITHSSDECGGVENADAGNRHQPLCRRVGPDQRDELCVEGCNPMVEILPLSSHVDDKLCLDCLGGEAAVLKGVLVSSRRRHRRAFGRR
jgi:hypothetical protein